MNTRTRRPAGQRAKPVNASAEGAFEDGKSEVEGLKEEMSEWKDNLENNNMEHLPKYDEVSECADALETAGDTLDGIDFPSCISDIPVNYTQDTRQQAQSRAGRLGNALSALEAAKAAGEEFLETKPELTFVDLSERDDDDQELGDDESDDQEAVTQRETDRSEVEQFINDMDEAIGELENVGFPGMY